MERENKLGQLCLTEHLILLNRQWRMKGCLTVEILPFGTKLN